LAINCQRLWDFADDGCIAGQEPPRYPPVG
jgi:hypothetical protein